MCGVKAVQIYMYIGSPNCASFMPHISSLIGRKVCLRYRKTCCVDEHLFPGEMLHRLLYSRLSAASTRHMAWRSSQHLSSQKCEANAAPSGTQILQPSRPFINFKDFSNHRLAFQHKTTRELLKSLFVLYSCSLDILVNNSYKILRVGERLIGGRLLRLVISPFYYQFCAGNSDQEMMITAHNLSKSGISLLVCPLVESDVGDQQIRSELLDNNLQETLDLVHMAARNNYLKPIPAMCHVKISALLSPEVMMRVHESFESLCFKDRIAVVMSVAEAMDPNSPSSPPFLGPLQLASEDSKDFLDCLPRLHEIGRVAAESKVILLIDGEYTYVKTTINLLSLAMMMIFNNESICVWNTYQGYLKDTLSILQHDLDIAAELDLKFGAKIVRGAYLEMERSRAQRLGYPDPVNDTHQLTNENYDNVVELMLRAVQTNQDKRAVMVATNNEASIRKAVTLLHKLGLDPQRGNAVFGQVYGMAENISVPLGVAGYRVYKSTPSGSVLEVLPYLSRRLNENRTVFKGARRERQLLSRELISRFRPTL